MNERNNNIIHEYVDLGLPSGTKWATCNVGATNPSDFGDYYAWGSIVAMEANKDYKWCTFDSEGRRDKFTKYCTDSKFGEVDGKISLDSSDDVATVMWGSEWRMPTHAEQIELRDGCDWEWTKDYQGSGVAGRIGTSKSNSNTIFFPAAGCLDEVSLHGMGYYGYYWSSCLFELYSYSAYCLFIRDENIIDERFLGAPRTIAQSVRAVLNVK